MDFVVGLIVGAALMFALASLAFYAESKRKEREGLRAIATHQPLDSKVVPRFCRECGERWPCETHQRVAEMFAERARYYRGMRDQMRGDGRWAG